MQDLQRKLNEYRTRLGLRQGAPAIGFPEKRTVNLEMRLVVEEFMLFFASGTHIQLHDYEVLRLRVLMEEALEKFGQVPAEGFPAFVETALRTVFAILNLLDGCGVPLEEAWALVSERIIATGSVGGVLASGKLQPSRVTATGVLQELVADKHAQYLEGLKASKLQAEAGKKQAYQERIHGKK